MPFRSKVIEYESYIIRVVSTFALLSNGSHFDFHKLRIHSDTSTVVHMRMFFFFTNDFESLSKGFKGKGFRGAPLSGGESSLSLRSPSAVRGDSERDAEIAAIIIGSSGGEVIISLRRLTISWLNTLTCLGTLGAGNGRRGISARGEKIGRVAARDRVIGAARGGAGRPRDGTGDFTVADRVRVPMGVVKKVWH
jgi:hypothetical protein